MRFVIICLFFYLIKNISLAEIPIIVISPSKISQSLDSVGSDLSIINQENILNSNQSFIGDILETYVPGTNFSNQGGDGTNSIIQLRGLPKRYTNIYIDGIKQSDPSTPDNAYYLNNLTSGSIKSIEVLKGNQSSIYGSSSFGGAINLFSKDGTEDNSKIIQLHTDSNKKKNISISYGNKTNKYNYSFTAEKFLTDNISAMSDNDETDPYRNDSINVAYRYNFSDKNRIETNFKIIDSFLNYDEVTSGREDRNTTDDQSFSSSVKIINEDKKIKNSIIIGHYYVKRKVSNYNLTSTNFYYGERKNINYLGEYNINLDKKIIFGLDNEFNRANFNTWATSGNKISDDTINSQYFELQQRHNNNFFSTIGLRNDTHSESGSFQTSRFTGSYVLDYTSKFRGSIGSGIRFGSLNDYYYDINIQNKKDLKPEKSYSLDLGYDKKIEKYKTNLNLTLFYTEYDNNISNWASNTDGGRSSYVIDNSDGKIKTKGFEIKTETKFNQSTSGNINYTYTSAYDGEDCDDPNKSGTSCSQSTYPVRVPKHSIISSLKKNFNKNFNSSIQFKYISSRRDYGNVNNDFADVMLNDYFVVNLNNNFELFNSNFYFNIKNIFNEKYEEAYQYNSKKRTLNFGLNKVF